MSYDEKTGLYTGYIYMIECDLEPHKKYIGQTMTHPNNRWSSHKYYGRNIEKTEKMGKNFRLYSEINRLGEDCFTLTFLETKEFKNKKDMEYWLDLTERFYIALYESTNPDKGYNIVNGGHKGSKRTTAMIISKYDLDGNYICDYTHFEIKQMYGTVSQIFMCCAGTVSCAYGYIWRKNKDSLNKYPLPTEETKKVVTTTQKLKHEIVQYNLLGNYITTYCNVQEASDKTGFPKSAIRNNCAHHSNHCGNSVFRFAGDEFDCTGFFKDHNIILEDGEYKVDGALLPRPIFVYDKDGNLLSQHSTIKEATEQYKVSRDVIKRSSNRCLPYIYLDKMYLFLDKPYSKEDILSIVEPFYKVFAYDLDGHFYGKYFTAVHAEKVTGISNRIILTYMNGKKKTITTDLVFYNKPVSKVS